MKRKTWMWIVLGGALSGITLAVITHPFMRPVAPNDAEAGASKIAAVDKKVQRALEADTSKPSPELIKEIQDLKEHGPDGQRAGGLLAWALLRHMHDQKLAEDSPEFGELASFLLSVDPTAPKTCAEALRKSRNPGDKPFEIRLLATFGKPAVSALMAAMEEDAQKAGDNYWQAAKSAYPQILAKLVPEAIPAVRAALKHENPAIRRQALRTMALMGLEGRERSLDTVSDVEAALKDKDKSVRAFAALALAELTTPNYVPAQALDNALNDPDCHVRLAVARTLGPLYRVDLQRVAEVVATLLKSEPFKDSWWEVADSSSPIYAYAALKGGEDYNQLFWDETAAHVLLSLGPRHNLPPETIVELLRGCRHDGRHLITLLAAQGSRAKNVVPELAKMVNDPDYPQRRKALIALGRLGKTVAGDALPEVLSALNHRDSRTRWQAFLALMQLDPAAAREKFPASMHPAINAATALKRTSLTSVSLWTRCLWLGSAAVLVPTTSAAADVDLLGVYRTPIDLDILTENDRIDNMLSVLARTPAVGKEAVPFLLDVWQGTQKKDAALAVLVKIGPAGLPALTKILDDPEAKDLHLKVLEVLETMGPAAKPAAPSLVKALAGSNEDVCDKAAQMFGVLGSAARDAVPGLRKLLQSKKNDTRRHAADALGLIGPEAKPALPDLIDLFQNENQTLRIVAVRAVSRIGKDAIEPLTKALEHPQEKVRLSAVEALARIPGDAKPALPALQRLAENDPSSDVRAEAAQLVKKLQAK
jgi:HEAT repeat protein